MDAALEQCKLVGSVLPCERHRSLSYEVTLHLNSHQRINLSHDSCSPCYDFCSFQIVVANMPPRPFCNSAGKVTATLLLSFLVVSSTIPPTTAAVDVQYAPELPILLPAPVPGGGDIPTAGDKTKELDFVSTPAPCILNRRLTIGCLIETETHLPPWDLPTSAST